MGRDEKRDRGPSAEHSTASATETSRPSEPSSGPIAAEPCGLPGDEPVPPPGEVTCAAELSPAPPGLATPPEQPMQEPIAGPGAPEPPRHAGAPPAAGGASIAARWFDLRAPSPPPPEPRRPPGYAAMTLGAAALVLFAFAKSVVLRVLLPLALAAASVALMLRGRRRPPRPRRFDLPLEPQPDRRAIALAGAEIAFHSGEGAPLFKATPPFGVTLVTSRARDRLVAAITSSEGAFYVGAALDPAARAACTRELARASILASDEVGLEAIGPDGEPVELPARELVALIDTLTRADATCLDRFVLSDARGAPVTLDQGELRARDVRFDLDAPLEWRALVFQEPFGQAVAVYQGTWIRQGANEIVLVSLLPAVAPLAWSTDAITGVAELDHAALRDLRLGQASPEPPPPAEQRVAIDRLFMLPLRAALDRAPRGSRRPSHANA